ncbi:MAG: hypothetical protein E7467_02115 [Ruminococcaceae bacterium]|nr:hypothetical protein [Oscillospiraceae bacterium]
MAAVDNFRSSLHGFNRTDVVQFIQQQTANHDKAMRMQKEESARLQDALTEARAEIERLTAENEALSLELEAARMALIAEPEVAEEALAAVEQPAPVLETPIAPIPAAPVAPTATDFNELELAAYRRAEMTERIARERANASAERMRAIFTQADERLSASAQDIATVYDAFRNDYEQLQKLLADVRAIVGDSSAGMKAASDICSEL